MTPNPQDALTAHEREQTCKVIDRLNDGAERSERWRSTWSDAVEGVNAQIAKLQRQRAALRKAEGRATEFRDNARFAVEMLEAELEGDPRWRSSSPEAANAEAQARAEVEKQEAQARGRVKIMEREA